jgi:hypothetical protein
MFSPKIVHTPVPPTAAHSSLRMFLRDRDLPEPLQGFNQVTLSMRTAAGQPLAIDRRKLALLKSVFEVMDDRHQSFGGTTLGDFVRTMAGRGISEIKMDVTFAQISGGLQVVLVLSPSDDFICHESYSYDVRGAVL